MPTDQPVNNSHNTRPCDNNEHELVFRKPRLEDGSKIHALIKSCKHLDLNSAYSYLILCEHFADTCVVAEEKGRVVAFLSGYHPPSSEDVIFVWQVAVDPRYRRRGVGKLLLRELLKRSSCKGRCYLETTITPSNNASWRLFGSFAKDLNATLEERVCFSKEHFGHNHEAEHLVCIGPLNQLGEINYE